MDYKELVESLKEWHRTICKMCGDDILTCDDLCGCTGDCIVVQAITAITELLTENQALRNAANGFKKQVEIAEAKVKNAESECDRLREAMKPNCLQCESMHKNGNCMEVGGFCTSVPAAHCPLIPKLLKKIREAESRAEKAESERDIAVEQLHHCENNCDYCRNRCECDKETCFSPSPITGEPTDYWKWCGLEE